MIGLPCRSTSSGRLNHLNHLQSNTRIIYQFSPCLSVDVTLYNYPERNCQFMWGTVVFVDPTRSLIKWYLEGHTMLCTSIYLFYQWWKIKMYSHINYLGSHGLCSIRSQICLPLGHWVCHQWNCLPSEVFTTQTGFKPFPIWHKCDCIKISAKKPKI